MKGLISSASVWVAVTSAVITTAFSPTNLSPVVVVGAHHRTTKALVVTMSTADSTTAAASEIQVISQPDQAFLEKKGVFNWSTWGCQASSFPWTYDSAESCYLLKGTVTVTPRDGRQPATFGTGDFVTFPAGMSCTWDVTEAVQKHYMFH
jgi:hypothetical protein